MKRTPLSLLLQVQSPAFWKAIDHGPCDPLPIPAKSFYVLLYLSPPTSFNAYLFYKLSMSIMAP